MKKKITLETTQTLLAHRFLPRSCCNLRLTITIHLQRSYFGLSYSHANSWVSAHLIFKGSIMFLIPVDRKTEIAVSENENSRFLNS